MEPTVTLTLHETGSDADRLDTLRRQLRSELGRIDSVEVRSSSHPPPTALPGAPPAASPHTPPVAPPGARGLDAGTVNAVAVTLLGSGGLTALVTAARAWLDRGHAAPRTIRLELDGDVLELSGATRDEHEQMVALFLDRHAREAPSWTADAAP